MLGYLRYLMLLLFLLFLLGIGQAQDLLSPSVFLRGLELANGVRYTATFIKPSDDTVLRNLSVEITLPADAQFTEMLVSRQVQFDVIRRNRQGQLTLIWQIARVDAETALDAFAFTVTETLDSEIEYYMIWEDEQGQRFLENFFETPSTIQANETEADFNPTNQAFALVGNTGIFAASSSTNPLHFRLLANDFNPPAEYGAVWWCSLMELSGLAESESASVLVPLRRPVAPFTELFLFQQQSDGSWLALDEKGIVSADGQFVMYEHSGGLIATGGEEEIRQESVPVEEAVIVEAPPQEENPQPQNNEHQPPPAPIENSVVVEVQPLPPVENPNPPQNNPEPTALPPSPLPATIAPQPTQDNTIRDGTSNTIIFGEATFTPAPLQNIQDGTSNTIIFGEATFTPVPLQNIQDGTSNTIIFGEATFTPLPRADQTTPLATLPFLEQSATPSPVADQTTPLVTLPFLEQSATPSAIFGDGSTQTPSPTQGISDGTSNTIIFGEATFTPSPTQGIRDGTSNTIQLGENTLTPTTAPVESTEEAIQTEETNPTEAANASFTPAPQATDFIVVTPPPFGTGGARILIVQNSEGKIVQCQVGNLLCAPLNRRAGNGLR